MIGCTCGKDGEFQICAYCQRAMKKIYDKNAADFGKDPDCYFCRNNLTAANCTASPFPRYDCPAHAKHGRELLAFFMTKTFAP